MIAVNVVRSWDGASLSKVYGAWPISDSNIVDHGDIVIGVVSGIIVAAFIPDTYKRVEGNKNGPSRVVFAPRTLVPRLAGTVLDPDPFPAGRAWPVAFLDTPVGFVGSVELDEGAETCQLGPFALTYEPATATLIVTTSSGIRLTLAG